MKTQIRICLTVEFKANFLFFSGLQRQTALLALVRPGSPVLPRACVLDDSDKGNVP